MRNLAEQLSLYQPYITQKSSKIAYYIAIPCILFAALIFFGWIHIAVPRIFSINLAWLLLVGLIIYYLLLDLLLGAGVAVIMILMTILAELISQPAINLAGFITFLVVLLIAAIALYVDYTENKKKPIFLDNLHLALIAPLFLFAELMFALGYRKDLQEDINKYLGAKK